MSDTFGRPGSKRDSDQQMLMGSGTAQSNMPVRVYSVDFTVTSTASPAAANIVLANCAPSHGQYSVCTVLNTATNSSTAFLTVYYDSEKIIGNGSWFTSTGMYFPNGVFIQTATAMGFYTIVYERLL